MKGGEGRQKRGSDAEFHYANDDDIETVFIGERTCEEVSEWDDK